MDLGCGAGRFVDLLADRCQQVLAVDASPRMVELARDRHDRPNITYRVEDLWRLTPAREGRFDVVLSVNTLHHLGPDPQAYLAHVR
ncbi:class I SAM-dependent methyltransferase, partial [Crossiella equi]